MFRGLALRLSLSTQLIILNYPVILSHGRSITVSLETYPLESKVDQVRHFWGQVQYAFLHFLILGMVI